MEKSRQRYPKARQSKEAVPAEPDAVTDMIRAANEPDRALLYLTNFCRGFFIFLLISLSVQVNEFHPKWEVGLVACFILCPVSLLALAFLEISQYRIRAEGEREVARILHERELHADQMRETESAKATNPSLGNQQ